ncbi:MAG TPA: hypothetical protein VFU70_03190, partial [Pseudolabrys sp.]|nr:hypothetical protein [Pseudolabrys sp.]
MSLANEFNRMDGESSLRRCATNVMTALNFLARPRRVRLPRSDAYSLPMLAIAAGVAIAVFLFLAWALDAAASRGAGHLPPWIISAFDDITDFGKSGWFLWPLGLSFLALAAFRYILAACDGDYRGRRNCRVPVSGLGARRCGEPRRQPSAALD